LHWIVESTEVSKGTIGLPPGMAVISLKIFETLATK